MAAHHRQADLAVGILLVDAAIHGLVDGRVARDAAASLVGHASAGCLAHVAIHVDVVPVAASPAMMSSSAATTVPANLAVHAPMRSPHPQTR